jgi:tight adherence protein B
VISSYVIQSLTQILGPATTLYPPRLLIAGTQYLSETALKALTPILIASLSALLAYLGWIQISKNIFNRTLEQAELTGIKRDKRDRSGSSSSHSTFVQLSQMILAFIATLAISILLTTSLEISVALSLLVTAIPFFVARRKAEKALKAQELAWPLAIDSLISSLQAGQSITEAVRGLSQFGPQALIPTFERVERGLDDGEAFEGLLVREMRDLDSSASDQTITTLLIAKEFGGRDVTVTLRLLSNFLREDFEAQEEIKTKFGWVRNSALLGAGAPWLILLLLSTQKNTVAAYASSAGKAVLSIGVIATALAFIWMERVARLPDPARPLRV